MSEKIKRVGILGGKRGMSFYAPINAQPGYRVAGVAEKVPERLEALRARVEPDTALCSSYEELVSLGIDVIVLANYFHEHCRYAIRAMEAGIDVISDTTAAPTAGDCLDLVECVERTGRKYFLAANCPVMVGPSELIRRYRAGELGEVLYAEAEYLHILGDTEESAAANLYPEIDHWRRYLPGTYYNMHSLGVLMAATGLTPPRGTAMEICTEKHAAKVHLKANRSPGAIALYEMDNGALFRSTGCCGFGPNGKWYRLSCEGGTIETTRLNQDRVLFRPNGAPAEEYDPEAQYTEEEKKSGHGGADMRICRKACTYLSGGDPGVYLDIYAAAALSLAAVYGLYSILDGKSYDIPDIRDKAAREVLRGDYRNPFPDPERPIDIPCSAHDMNVLK